MAEDQPKKRKIPQPNVQIGLIIATIIVALVAIGYFYQQYRDTKKELEKFQSDPKQSASQENKELINKVGALVALPEGEDPTVATVTDIEKLKNQPFFSKAKNGDKVLIYTQAKKAYLYDPQANKVLEIAPLNIGSPQPSPRTSPNPTPQ